MNEKKKNMLIKISILLLAFINAILGMDSKKWKEQRTKTYWIISILIFMGILSTYQYMSDKNEANIKNLTEISNRTKDSINYQKGFENILEKNHSQMDNIAGQLNQLGFKIDAVSNRIIKVNSRVVPDSVIINMQKELSHTLRADVP